MVKILLNSPCNYYTSVEILTNPIGLSYIKTFCEDKNPHVRISIVPYIDKELLERERPDIVGLSCYAATYGQAIKVAGMCKEYGVHVVVGGEQITTLPNLITDDMDIGVIGEGERAFEKLLRVYNGGWKGEELLDVPGIVFRDSQGGLVQTEPASPLKDLDSLPVPDLLQGNEKTDTLCIMTSRGCPYRCVFCATGWHRNVRWFSPEKVLETIKYHAERYPALQRVKFWDDLFTVKKERVRRIVDLLEEEGLTARFNYSVATRADHISEELLHQLKRMNCIHVSLGMESGSNRTLEYINKGTTVETNRKAALMLRRFDLFSESSFIIGFPEETREEIMETYDFIRATPLNKVQVFLPVPYPGTKLWEHALAKGLVSETVDMDWEALDLIATMYRPRQVLDRFIVLSEILSKQELYKLLRKFGRLARVKTFLYALILLRRNPRILINRFMRELVFLLVRRKRN
ncbi:MAG: radical SAM protein [bacterium]|nr:radical SAM protein [bacterium]